MKIFAYSYTEPLLEMPPDPEIWGWEVDCIYQDLGERGQLLQLLKDCEMNPTAYLLVRRLEELGDSIADICQRLTQLETLNIHLIILEQNIPNLDTNPRITLLKLLNEIQQHQHRRKICQGHARNRIKALPPPGKAPYGYRRGKDRYALDRSAAPVVKDFFDHFLLYGSLRGAVRYLEKKYGKKISVSTGHHWLTNAVYRGDLKYRKNEVISNTHVPIISRDEAAQVDRLLRRNRCLAPRTASAPRSLAGLVTCGECQSSMIVAKVTPYRQRQEYLYLRPSHCPNQPKCKALPYQQVLEAIIDQICRDLPSAVAGLKMPDMNQVKQGIVGTISEKQTVIEQLPNLVTSGILDTETADLRAYKLRTEISALQSQLAQLPPVNLRETAQAIALPQFWLDLSESERRFYFREFIRQVQISRQDNGWQIQVIFIF